jgi:hypothetical protein
MILLWLSDMLSRDRRDWSTERRRTTDAILLLTMAVFLPSFLLGTMLLSSLGFNDRFATLLIFHTCLSLAVAVARSGLFSFRMSPSGTSRNFAAPRLLSVKKRYAGPKS